MALRSEVGDQLDGGAVMMMEGGEGIGLGCAGFELCGVHADGKGPGRPSVLGLFVLTVLG